MKAPVSHNKELQEKLKQITKEHDLEKNYTHKALYHSEVTSGGNIIR